MYRRLHISSPIDLLNLEQSSFVGFRLERNKAAIARYRARNAEAKAAGTHAAAISAAETDGGVVVGAHGVCFGR